MRNVRPAVWIAASLVVLAGCNGGRTTSSPRPSGVPTSRPQTISTATGVPQRPAARPSVTARPAPSPAAASPTPSRQSLGALLPPMPKKVTRVAPDAAPRILDVAVSETTVRPGDQVFGRVVTTSNVASVEARIGGYAVNLVKVGVGRFELTYTVGPLPWFVRGNFTMQVTARNPRGDTVTRAIPLTVR